MKIGKTYSNIVVCVNGRSLFSSPFVEYLSHTCCIEYSCSISIVYYLRSSRRIYFSTKNYNKTLTHFTLVISYGDNDLDYYLVQIMACCLCCLPASSYYLNHCWQIIMGLCIIHPGEILQGISSDILLFEFLLHFAAANVLTYLPLICSSVIRAALVQIIACRLFSAKPLFKTLLGCCQLDH